MDKKLYQAINEQINKEWFSAYLYLSMAAYFDANNLPGFAQWMKKQAKEEYGHGEKFYEFLNDRGQAVSLKAIAQPETNFTSVAEVWQKTLAHEKTVTASINALYALAKETGDTAAEVLLHWFITEQVEEEKNATTVIETLKQLKGEGPALIMLDRELGKRG